MKQTILNKNKRRTLFCKGLSTFVMMVVVCVLTPHIAFAACANPAGDIGEMIYNADSDKPQYCDGTNWIEMIKTLGGNCSGPADCPNIGDQCTDNTIFIGCHPVLFSDMFIHPNNQSASSTWGSTGDITGATDISDGKANQDWIVANRTITNFPAFKLCDDLNGASALGHNDWYLPSRAEMFHMWSVRSDINAGPGDSFVATTYWTSTQENSNSAHYYAFDNGYEFYILKSNTYDVRCMRRD